MGSTSLLARREGTIAGKPAYAAEFAVANIDQLHLAKNARRSHVKVVLIRPGFDHGWGSLSSGANLFGDNLSMKPKKEPQGDQPAAKFPVLMVAGFASFPEDFSKGEPDFDALLARLIVDGKSGVQLTAAPTIAPPITAAPPASVAPASASPSPRLLPNPRRQ